MNPSYNELCVKSHKQYLTIQDRKSFDDSRKLCRGIRYKKFGTFLEFLSQLKTTLSKYADIGGAMAVVRGETELEAMLKSFKSSNCSRGFYSGHTDRQTEGRWRTVDSGQEVTGLR